MSTAYEQIKTVLDALASKQGILPDAQEHVGVLKGAGSDELKQHVAQYVADKFTESQVDPQQIYYLFSAVMAQLFTNQPFNNDISDDVRKLVCQGFCDGVVKLASDSKITPDKASELLGSFEKVMIASDVNDGDMFAANRTSLSSWVYGLADHPYVDALERGAQQNPQDKLAAQGTKDGVRRAAG